MSRSRKKVAAGTCVCCKSQKRGKQNAPRRFRRLSAAYMASGYYERLPYRSCELTNPWDLGGDGKMVYTFDRNSDDFKRWTRK